MTLTEFLALPRSFTRRRYGSREKPRWFCWVGVAVPRGSVPQGNLECPLEHWGHVVDCGDPWPQHTPRKDAQDAVLARVWLRLFGGTPEEHATADGLWAAYTERAKAKARA